MQPFLTLYTATYKRPQQLARCLASVAMQTLVNEIEHIVIPDHVGLGMRCMASMSISLRMMTCWPTLAWWK
jgi:hypothetical protein